MTAHMFRAGSLVALAICGIALICGACRDDVRWEESGGDVGGSSYRLLDYDVTSERYRRWIAAHRALDGVEIGDPVSVDLRRLTDNDIDRVEESLESHAAARASIEGAGMSVRDFVLTTIALAQPWVEENQSAAGTIDIADPGPTVRRRAAPSRARVRVSDDSDDDDDDSDDDDSHKKKRKRKR